MNKNLLDFCTDYEIIRKNILYNIDDFIKTNNTKTFVVGVSGGIDSCLTLALLKEYSREAATPINIIGRSLWMPGNKTIEKAVAEIVGEAFCENFKIKDLTITYQLARLGMFAGTFLKSKKDINLRIRLGNLKARLRMIYLYNTAAENKGVVMSTDNFTELLLGFWTLHGDVGDFGLIQNLWKTEVYGLAAYLADRFSVNKNLQAFEAIKAASRMSPTDGLGVSNNDLDQLGVDSYEEVDRRLLMYIRHRKMAEYDCPVVTRHIRTEFKRNNPTNIPREHLLENI